jgi:hypothetical protein
MNNNSNYHYENPFVEAIMKPMMGVRYVNTTHEEFIKMMNERHQDVPDFNLSTRKVDEYKCDLGPAPDDASKEWGAIYLFPHYLICSPMNIEPDIKDTDLVDITYFCTYNEQTIVLIDKKDMNCPGFRRFVFDTLDNTLHTVNGCMIPKTRDPENYLSYRQLMAMIRFVNKYNTHLHIFPSYSFKYVLVHTFSSNGCYHRYAIATIDENGNNIVAVANNPTTKSTAKSTAKKKSAKHKEAFANFEKISDMIDYEITNHDTFANDLITDYEDNLKKLAKEFNKKVDEVGIEEAWKTKVGFIILKYIDYIGEFKTEDMKPIKLYVDAYKHLCFTNRVKKSEISGFSLPTPQANPDYKYNPDDFEVEDDSDYITTPGDMIIIFNNKNLEEDAD